MGQDLGAFLVEHGLITQQHLLKAQQVQQSVRSPDLLRVVVDMQFMTQSEALRAKSDFEK